MSEIECGITSQKSILIQAKCSAKNAKNCYQLAARNQDMAISVYLSVSTECVAKLSVYLSVSAKSQFITFGMVSFSTETKHLVLVDL
jgi:hypothetical protein